MIKAMFILYLGLAIMPGLNTIIDLTPKAVKTMDKTLSKIWSDIELQKEEIVIPDSVNYTDGLFIEPKSLYQISTNDSLLGYAFVVVANGCKIGGCTKEDMHVIEEYNGRFENFDFMVVFNPELSIIKVKVLQYRAEHGYEISSKNWLKQFKGPIQHRKYGRDIDAISGATVSAQSITKNINEVGDYMKKLKELGLI